MVRLGYGLRVSPEEAIEHGRHMNLWGISNPERTVGPFFIRTGYAHPEAPFALVVERGQRGGEKLGTVGFRLVFREPGKPVVSINSIQGTSGKAAELKELSEKLGENWRVHLARNVIEYARNNGLRVEGEIPTPEKIFTPEAIEKRTMEVRKFELDRTRVVRQYEQTYRKLGFEKTGGVWRSPEEKVGVEMSYLEPLRAGAADFIGRLFRRQK